MITLEKNLTDIGRIQASYHAGLKRLGLFSIEDLLRHFPSKYEDRSHISYVSEVTVGDVVTINVSLLDVKVKSIPQRKLHITEAVFEDATASIRATWFNQPYIEKTLRSVSEMRVSGKVMQDKNGIFLRSPDVERAARTPTSTGRVIPVYPETARLTSKWLRWQIQLILEQLPTIPDPIPNRILQEKSLPSVTEALHTIHFPENEDALHRAQERFAFEDLFLLQVYTLRARALLTHEPAHPIPFDQELIKTFVDRLPFTLTDAQRTSTFQILRDLEKAHPMNRLLNGDVGAGKTLVAVIAALQVVSAGGQVALLAPTEVLAAQHFKTLLELLEPYEISLALFTSAHKKTGACDALVRTMTRSQIRDHIASGGADIVIGTHAIIQEDVVFKKLALVVIDEQQRFGVAQRSALVDNVRTHAHDGGVQTNKCVPHFLTMTATPIPRTFSLALFGDLSVSLLDEKPAERLPIKTAIVDTRHEDVYSFMKDEITAGRQCYVILPLVEDSEMLAHVKSATAECERLQREVFPQHNVGLLHGKMKSKEKEHVMNQFKSHHIDILVATSVVEVGVDVPNASVMIIENAERFGLSQLHQFRGRIGRGKHQSYCFLFSNQKHSERLRALEKHTDGFKLAEIDLKLRGPGEFIGTRQSGLPDGVMKNITNLALVTETRDAARSILTKDPNLKTCPPLKKALSRFVMRMHME